MHSIDPDVRTTPSVRAEIALSSEPPCVLAQRFGVNADTIRKWGKLAELRC